jgi:hypothetical protein
MACCWVPVVAPLGMYGWYCCMDGTDWYCAACDHVPSATKRTDAW